MPAPANDAFASATALSTTLPSTLTGQTTVDSTNESGEPLISGGDYVQGVWYTFTPTSTGRYKFSCDVSSTVVWTDTRQLALELFTGSAVGSLTLVVRQHNQSNGSSDALRDGDRLAIEADLTSGVTYRIRVGSRYFTGEAANAHSANFDINAESLGTPSAPANDNLANATNLGTNPADGNYAGTMVGATDDAGAFNYGNATVWAKFVAGATGTKEMHIVNPDYTPGSAYANDDFNPYFELHRVTGANPPTSFSDLTFVDDTSADGFPDFFEWKQNLTASLISGETYYILIYPNQWQSGLTGDYQIVFGAYVPAAPPPNNNRASAVALSDWDLAKSHYGSYLSYPRARAIEGTTELATVEGGDPVIAGFAPMRNVWYRFKAYDTADYKVWVESAVDCLLAVYEIGISESVGTFIDDDDDSGTGNWPELTFTANPAKTYWILVDSKTEGDFTLKFQEVVVGTPPGNDQFANATVISSIPYSAAGTTVGANAEPGEKDSETLGLGPTDSVWYKYVATADKQLNVYARSVTGNNDGYVVIDTWKGTTLANIVRYPTPLNLTKGFFSIGDTEQQIKNNTLIMNVVNGETYYIRVQTESGGSEGFTLYLDEQVVYVDIQPSGLDVGPYADSFTVYVNITASGVEEFHGTILDTATVYVDIQPITIYEAQGAQRTDSATIYIDIRNTGGECYSTHMGSAMDMECDPRWTMTCDTRWTMDADPRWTVEEIDGLGVHC